MKDKPPLPMVEITSRGLRPLTAYDEECLDGMKMGQVFDLKPNRTLADAHTKLLRKYWAVLGNVVTATQRWPTREHLHSVLKIDCGYIDKVVGLDGKIHEIPDSIALSAMNYDELATYFETAIAKLAECVGFDPLEDNR